MMKHFLAFCIVLGLLACPIDRAARAQSGQMTHDSVALGLHFLHSRADWNTTGQTVKDPAPCIWDYFRYTPEDLAYVSYADFWHWWWEFERYKGDEKGLDEFGAILDACLAHGMKVKMDLAHSTWWTNDRDWENGALTMGPVDVDDWIHLCDLLGRRYRGRMALWHLQGEANDMEGYWQGLPVSHVANIYRTGYQAFKRVDPGVMVSIAGATPSKPKESLDEWVRYHANACKGFCDDIPMNYFPDIKGADPYHSLEDYYKTIRRVLDESGQPDVEIGSGESAFQWAEDSYKVTGRPGRWNPNYDVNLQPELSEEGQAWRCNESLATFFQLGGNKFMFSGTEYAPGFGWPWRWGLRKYQDWWNAWPDDKKVSGTNIVFGYDNPDGRKIDFRPVWTSAPTDPYHPIWQVYKFWAQAAPPASEAVRLPLKADRDVRSLAAYLQTQDGCVVLVQGNGDAPVAAVARVDVKKTGWPDGTNIQVVQGEQTINYLDGQSHTVSVVMDGVVTGGAVELPISNINGFTTLNFARKLPAFRAECLKATGLGEAVIGKPIEAVVVLRNTGTATWPATSVVLAGQGSLPADWACKVPRDVAPGEAVSVVVTLPAVADKGYVTHLLRMRDGQQWFGPAFPVSIAVKDFESPRKLVAFRELGHIRLKWFAPERPSGVVAYELYRADGFQKPFSLLAKVEGTDYVDEPPIKDQGYYYYVAAIDGQGRRSHASNEDNAKAQSKPRIWDAEVIEHSVPQKMKLAESQTVTVTLRNTGSKPWQPNHTDAGTRWFLTTTQLWGNQDETHLPRIELPGDAAVEPGQTATFTIPYAAYRTGCYENHWVLAMTAPGRQTVYIGTPLLMETVVE